MRDLEEYFNKPSEAEKIYLTDLGKVAIPVYEAIMLSIAYTRGFIELSRMVERNRRSTDFILDNYEQLTQLFEEQNRLQDCYDLHMYMLKLRQDDLPLKIKLAEICLQSNRLEEAAEKIRSLPQKLVISRLLQAKLYMCRS